MAAERCLTRSTVATLTASDAIAILRADALDVVIPAKAGIHFDLALSLFALRSKAKSKWVPAFAGMTMGRRISSDNFPIE